MNKMIKRIEPLSRVQARVRIPGSKSVTHRALLMAALAREPSEIENPLVAEDTLLTAKALRQLGVRVSWEDDEKILVTPPEKRWKTPEGPILLGNSGTSMRLLPAVAATGIGTFVLDGTPRLRERPIGPVMDALGSLGVKYRYLGRPGCPPVEITSRGLSGGEVWVDGSQSSQFLSALLIASPLAAKETKVGWREPVASFPYIALTLAMMEELGIEYRWLSGNQVAIPAPQAYPPLRYRVEGDCSSASYFWAAAALTGGEVFTHPIYPGSSQGDCRFLDVLQEMGCRILWEEDGVRVAGPETGSLSPVDLDMNKMPDMVPTLAVLSAFAEGQTRIRNVAHLRVKESDRLKVVALELSKLGVPVQELPDGLVIEGGHARPPESPIEAHDDHRIAMAFAVAGLRVEGVRIDGAESVAKSFPSFWDLFESLRINT
jgi:3-phosphoshikimate 1-carboxyvinyltransferase